MIYSNKVTKYIKWLDPEEMHEASKNWNSELSFIGDEQLFLEELVNTYTLQLTEISKFNENMKLIDTLGTLQKQHEELTKKVKDHMNGLEILVDGVDQLDKEAEYKNEHKALLKLLPEYVAAYRLLKTELFQVFKTILKDEKQKHLIRNK